MNPNWFIGLKVPGDWLAAVVRQAPATMRRFHPDELHLTVAFLGSCSEEHALAAWALTRGQGRYDVELGKLVAMGSKKKPSALAADLVRPQAVAAYMARWRRPLCEAAGARVDKRPPLPHVTIGRPALGASFGERAALMAWGREQGALEIKLRLDTLALYTWAHDRSQRQFRIVQQKPL